MRRTIHSVMLAALACFASVSSAVVVEADWKVAGDKQITRDTQTGIDWLDLTLTTNMTLAQAASQTGAGGAFAGFRVARLKDLIGLYSHAVAPVTPSYNGNTPIFDFTAEEAARLRVFIGYLGQLPGSDDRIQTQGFLRPTPGNEVLDHIALGLFESYNDGSSNFSWFNEDAAGPGVFGPEGGVYLIRGGVPEASTWMLMIAGFGMSGAAIRRRKQLRLV